MRSEYSFQLVVNRGLSRRPYPQIQDTYMERSHKYEVPKVPVTRDEEPALLLSRFQQSLIFCLGQSDLSDQDDIVPQLLQKPGSDRIHVLVEQELHAGVGVR